MSEPRVDPAEQEVERTLSRLNPPAPQRVNAASVLIEVHRRRGRIQLWTWRAVAAVLAVAMSIQFSLNRLQAPPAPTPQPQLVADATRPTKHSDLPPLFLPVAGDDYISTRNRMIAFEARPPHPPASGALPPANPLNSSSTSPRNLPSPSLLELLFTNSDPVQS